MRGWLLSQIEGEGLKALTIRGSMWTTGGFAVSQFVRIGGNLILTRILAPEMFGLMALVQMVMAGLQLFSDFGIRDALIRNPRGGDPDFYSTAWTMQVIRGFILTLAALAVAYPVSALYEHPELFGLLLIVSIGPAIDGFQSVALHLKVREMQMRRLVICEVAVHVMSLCVMIVLALWLRSVWALALGWAASALIHVALSYLLLPRYRQRLLLDRGAAREILGFGKWIFVATIMTFAGLGGVTAAQGFLVPLEILAFLSIAGNFSRLLNMFASRITGSVGLSAIAQAHRTDRTRMTRGVRKIGRAVALFSAAGAIALAAVSEPAIKLVYDPRYHDVGLYLQFLALGVGIGNLSMVYGSALLAMGQSRTYAAFKGAEAAARLGGLYVGFQLGGPVGMTVGLGVGNAAALLLALLIARRGGYADTAFTLGVLAALAAAMATALYFL